MELIMPHLLLAFPAHFSIFGGSRDFSVLFAMWNRNSRDWLWLSALCRADRYVCVCERSFAHHYILQGLEPSKSFGLCQFPLFQGKADRKCWCRCRRSLQGDSVLFLFRSVILWWALDFLSGIHETSFWLQKAISGWFIAPIASAQEEEYVLVPIFCLIPCVLLCLTFLC